MPALAFAFTKIAVADLDAAERFYREAIGLKLIARTTAPDGDYGQEECIMSVTGGNDANQLILIRYLNRPAPKPEEAWTGFAVSDVEESVAAVERGGGKVLMPPFEVPDYGIKATVVADPEGHLIELIQMLGAS